MSGQMIVVAADLAARINEEHILAQQHAGAAAAHAREVGLLLEAAKKKVQHGKWLPWLRANVKFSERTAQAYMRLAGDRRVAAEIRKGAADLSVTKALQLIATPRKKSFEDEIRAYCELPPLKPREEWVRIPGQLIPDEARECAARIHMFDEMMHRYGLCNGDCCCVVCGNAKPPQLCEPRCSVCIGELQA